MDTEMHDQTFIPSDLLGEQLKFLKEGDSVKMLFNEGIAITAELPNFIEFKVIQVDSGVKGDSASNIQKFCTIERERKFWCRFLRKTVSFETMNFMLEHLKEDQNEN